MAPPPKENYRTPHWCGAGLYWHTLGLVAGVVYATLIHSGAFERVYRAA